MLQNTHDSRAQLAGKVAENQVRICFRDGFLIFVLDIMAKDDVVKGKVGSGSIGEM